MFFFFLIMGKKQKHSVATGQEIIAGNKEVSSLCVACYHLKTLTNAIISRDISGLHKPSRSA